MSVKILVVDRNMNSVVKARVNVIWSPSGTSQGETNYNGLVDLRCSGGIIKEIKIFDKPAEGFFERRVNDNETVQVGYNS
jgi:hypothetical protein